MFEEEDQGRIRMAFDRLYAGGPLGGSVTRINFFLNNDHIRQLIAFLDPHAICLLELFEFLLSSFITSGMLFCGGQLLVKRAMSKM